MSIKAIGIAIKLTMEGVSQIGYPQTWLFLMVAVTCVVTQLIYLNKVSFDKNRTVNAISRSSINYTIPVLTCSLAGFGYIQCSNCFPSVLCNVHNPHYCC